MGAPVHRPYERPLEQGDGPRRITRVMSSRRLQALDFIKRYFLEWGQSPTLSEISAALGVSAKRAHELVHQLVAEGLIEHVAGKTRGIRLIDQGEAMSEVDVLIRLSALGWNIGLGDRIVRPPAGDQTGVILVNDDNSSGPALSDLLLQTLTEKGLHALPRLDHDQIDQDKAGNDGSEQGENPQDA